MCHPHWPLRESRFLLGQSRPRSPCGSGASTPPRRAGPRRRGPGPGLAGRRLPRVLGRVGRLGGGLRCQVGGAEKGPEPGSLCSPLPPFLPLPRRVGRPAPGHSAGEGPLPGGPPPHCPQPAPRRCVGGGAPGIWDSGRDRGGVGPDHLFWSDPGTKASCSGEPVP